MDIVGTAGIRRSVFIVNGDEAIREYYRKLFSPGDRELDILEREEPLPGDAIDLRLFPEPGGLVSAIDAERKGGNRIALCILDSGPAESGDLGLARDIRAIDPEAVIVLCSASQALDADRIRRDFQSSVLLVRKPFAADEFRLLIHSLLREWEARRNLRRNEERLTRILEATRVGTWEWNVQTGETAFNERWAEMVGYGLGELEPVSIATWTGLVHPEDRAVSEALLERHFSGELPYYDCECRMRHKDGRWVWVHDRGKVIERDASGKPLLMSGTHSDISDRKKAELERLETEQRLEWALDATSDGIWDWDMRGDLVVHNLRWCEMLGLDGGALKHPISFFWERVYPDDRPKVEAALRVCTEGRGPYESRHRLVRQDGGVIWVIDRGKVVDRDESGQPRRMVGSLIKLHEERRAPR